MGRLFQHLQILCINSDPKGAFHNGGGETFQAGKDEQRELLEFVCSGMSSLSHCSVSAQWRFFNNNHKAWRPVSLFCR